MSSYSDSDDENNDLHDIDQFDMMLNLKDSKDKYEIIEKNSVFVINTKDRNPQIETNSRFSVSFSSNFNGQFLTINKPIKNIVCIDILHLILPDCYVNIEDTLNLFHNGLITSTAIDSSNTSNNIRLQKLVDLPYLLLEINEFESNVSGTDVEINKASFVLILDNSADKNTENSGAYTLNSNNKNTELGNINKSFVADSKRKMLYYVNGSKKIDFYSSRKSNLKTLKFRLKTPDGQILNNFTPYVNIQKIVLNSGNKKIQIYLDKFICSEEFYLGERILIKELTLNDTTNINIIQLMDFLKRKQGHIIIGHANDSDATSDGNRIFKILEIPYEFYFDRTNGTSEIVNNFAKDNTEQTVLCDTSQTNLCINLDTETTIMLDVQWEERTNQFLHTNII